MSNTELEAQVRLMATKSAVDAAASRHAQFVAHAVREVTSTANAVAKTAAFGILLGARYVAGFAQELRRDPNA
jgi:hypothetical protein